MRLTIIGCGDAFGSGGRGNTCFWIEAGGATMLLDFGATALVELKRGGFDPKQVDFILLSHLHGDHFGGLPFLLLDYQFDSRRDKALTIIGPVGTAERIRQAQEVFFPGTSQIPWRFPLEIVELPCGRLHRASGFEIESQEVIHPSGAPATGVRVRADGKLLAYSGDTSWTETLVDLARGSDFFMVDCHDVNDTHAPHLDFEALAANRNRLEADRIMVTHLGEDMLGRADEAKQHGFLIADDGMVIDI